MFNNLKSGIRIYKGKHAAELNLLWWGIAPLCSILMAVGILNSNLTRLFWTGLALAVVVSAAYVLFATKNEEDRYPWEKEEKDKLQD